jgi:hypothetical protein
MSNHIWDFRTRYGLFDIRGREGDGSGSPTGKARSIITPRNGVGRPMSEIVELSSLNLV